MRQLAKKALDRAEVLKAQERKSPSLELPEPPVNGMFLSYYRYFYSNSYYYSFLLYVCKIFQTILFVPKSERFCQTDEIWLLQLI